MLKQWIKRKKRGTKKEENKPRWEADYELVENEGLFQEYLEMSEWPSSRAWKQNLCGDDWSFFFSYEWKVIPITSIISRWNLVVWVKVVNDWHFDNLSEVIFRVKWRLEIQTNIVISFSVLWLVVDKVMWLVVRIVSSDSCHVKFHLLGRQELMWYFLLPYTSRHSRNDQLLLCSHFQLAISLFWPFSLQLITLPLISCRSA